MNNNLNQKEQMLLQDQQSHEEMCVKKYKNYAEQASDPELKDLFNTFAQQEEQHLQTINKHLGSGSQANATKAGLQSDQKNDAELCEDMLMTEKYVSDTYNTAVFEIRDSSIRQDLAHIQQEEQQHGEGLFNYMNSKGYYNTQ